MQTQFFAPSDELAPFVRYYWYSQSGPDSDSTEQSWLFPTGNSYFIFNYGSSGQLQTDSGGIPLPEHYFSGQLIRAQSIIYQQPVRQLGLCLSARGAYSLLKTDMEPLSGRLCLQPSEMPAVCKPLTEAAVRNSCSDEVINRTERVLAKHISEAPLPDAAHEFFSYPENNCRNFRTRDMAKALNISPSTLERRCKHYIGLPPKTYTDLLKFSQNMPAAESCQQLRYYREHFHRIRNQDKYERKTADLSKTCSEIQT